MFIDGDHSKEGVVKDFMKYRHFISPGGFILFDNYDQPFAWEGVKIGIDSINFNLYDFTIIGQFGYSFLVQKKP